MHTQIVNVYKVRPFAPDGSTPIAKYIWCQKDCGDERCKYSERHKNRGEHDCNKEGCYKKEL